MKIPSVLTERVLHLGTDDLPMVDPGTPRALLKSIPLHGTCLYFIPSLKHAKNFLVLSLANAFEIAPR
jgi:hypothetical protein